MAIRGSVTGGHKMILRHVETLRATYIHFVEALLASKQRSRHMWLRQDRPDL